MNKEHTHDLKQIGYITEFGTVARSNKLVTDVESRTIDRIILTRSCKCGLSQAFECGDKDAMRQLFAKLRREHVKHIQTRHGKES